MGGTTSGQWSVVQTAHKIVHVLSPHTNRGGIKHFLVEYICLYSHTTFHPYSMTYTG